MQKPSLSLGIMKAALDALLSLAFPARITKQLVIRSGGPTSGTSVNLTRTIVGGTRAPSENVVRRSRRSLRGSKTVLTLFSKLIKVLPAPTAAQLHLRTMLLTPQRKICTRVTFNSRLDVKRRRVAFFTEQLRNAIFASAQLI